MGYKEDQEETRRLREGHHVLNRRHTDPGCKPNRKRDPLQVVSIVAVGMVLAVVGVLLLSGCSSVPQQDYTQAVTTLAGVQTYDEDNGEDIQSATVGVQYEYEIDDPFDDGLMPECGFLFSRASDRMWLWTPQGVPGEEFDVTMTTYEVYTGLRKDWRLGPVTPYLGAGFSLMLVDVDALGGSDEDMHFGGYVKGGARYQLTDRCAVGAELRWHGYDEFEISGEDVSVEGDLSGTAALVTLTWGF